MVNWSRHILSFNQKFFITIKNCLLYMIGSPDLMQSVVAKTKQNSQTYNWKNCEDETFAILSIVHEKNKK